MCACVNVFKSVCECVVIFVFVCGSVCVCARVVFVLGMLVSVRENVRMEIPLREERERKRERKKERECYNSLEYLQTKIEGG